MNWNIRPIKGPNRFLIWKERIFAALSSSIVRLRGTKKITRSDLARSSSESSNGNRRSSSTFSSVMEDVKGKELIDDTPTEQIGNNKVSDEMENHKQPSSESEENAIKKKYGGLLPKKIPLISKDHERAFFDSADWALGKQKGQKPKGPLEALRPKLQPTPHQQPRARRMAYSSGDNTEETETDNNESPDDQACISEAADKTNLKDDGGSNDDAKDNIKS